ncbi:uncharacterized protein LOC116431438 isoform X2 [Nomia melanderi]|uniref:uncharacterized protein LOC116431438 isoform X2 n=1 Tax=Nomia melanderi TaxID=2448451 RepID=UPI0013044411|nr:uncharacterized protein LOC116431438 isoform X2 [Nomia melanderi]
MPVATVLSVQQEVTRIIKRFKFEELESAVMSLFPEISWSNIRSELVKHHNSFTSANVAQLIRTVITDRNIKEKDLKDRLATLQLIDISWHSDRRTWYGHLLQGSSTYISYFKHRKILVDMQDYFNSLHMKINVKMYIHNGVTYIALISKEDNQRKKKIRSGLPITFALFMGQKCFFSNRKNVSQDMLQAIVQSTGYGKSKQINLAGKNLVSLSKMCWRRKQRALNFENVNNTVEYKDSGPERKASGIDFTQHKQRKKYAENCFGDNPATLELLVINGYNMPFAHEDISKRLPNESTSAKWEYRSPNITGLLTKLIEQRILVTPVPYYVSNLMVLGKNEFTIS